MLYLLITFCLTRCPMATFSFFFSQLGRYLMKMYTYGSENSSLNMETTWSNYKHTRFFIKNVPDGMPLI